MYQMDQDKLAAIELLRRHGYAFQIYGTEEVHAVLDQFGKDQFYPCDTETFRNQITAHIMAGDDWAEMSYPYADTEYLLWNMIAGTKGDHPEWFPTKNA